MEVFNRIYPESLDKFGNENANRQTWTLTIIFVVLVPIDVGLGQGRWLSLTAGLYIISRDWLWQDRSHLRLGVAFGSCNEISPRGTRCTFVDIIGQKRVEWTGSPNVLITCHWCWLWKFEAEDRGSRVLDLLKAQYIALLSLAGRTSSRLKNGRQTKISLVESRLNKYSKKPVNLQRKCEARVSSQVSSRRSQNKVHTWELWVFSTCCIHLSTVAFRE
jgi:hypothetical protein